MAASFTIPSIFTAIDKLSAPVKGMMKNMDTFVSKSEAGLARSERAFRKFTPSVGDATKKILSFASAGLALGALAVSGKSIMDYETSIASLSAITGTSGKELDVFKDKIKKVSMATKESSINVANAFTQIGNNSPQLLKDAEGLAEVTKQSIILAQASKMELAPAADYLTKIMNQFNTPANEAKKVIDLLAGGMVIGSTDIDKISESMLIFGGAANQAHISLAESVTAIETISDKVTDMSRLGTQFRNIFSRMEHASVLDKTALKALKEAKVDMTVLESKTAPFVDKLKQLKKLQNVKGGLVAVFNEENQQSLIPLLNSIEKYEGQLKTLTKSEEAQNAAQKMADKNNATFAKSVEHLQNKFITWITTSDEATKALHILKTAMHFLADNMSTIITWTGRIIGMVTLWWLSMKILKGWILATKAVSTLFYVTDMIKYVASTQGITFATAAWAVAQETVNVAMMANPIGLIILALMAVGAAIAYVIDNWDEITRSMQPAFILIKAIGTYIKNDLLSTFNQLGYFIDALGKLFSGDFAGANKIMEKAGMEKFTQMKEQAELMQKATKDAAISVLANQVIDKQQNGEPGGMAGDEMNMKRLLDPKLHRQDAMVQQMTSTNNAKVDINVNTNGNDVEATSNSNFVKIATSSTQALGLKR